VAEAQAVIARLAQQVAQLTVDKAVLEAEVEELRARLVAAESPAAEPDRPASNEGPKSATPPAGRRGRG